MEFISDYDCNIEYHPGKADVVADALSRKGRLSILRAMEREPILEMNKLNTQFKIGVDGSLLAELRVRPILFDQIRATQQKDKDTQKLMKEMQETEKSELKMGNDGILRMKDRMCVPDSEEIKHWILEEAHNTPYNMHPGAL